LIIHIIRGSAAPSGSAAELPGALLADFTSVESASSRQANYYLRGSHQRNADRRKEPDKPFLKRETHEYFQRKTR
jgi:hypothetical protein